MSIQWTFIAGCLYAEIAFVLILILPIASPRKWSKLFRSRLFSYIQSHVSFYFYTLLGLMGLLFVDSLREMRKYSVSTDTTYVDFATGMKGHVKLFRAQRNLYITGFAIFLVIVIRRLITMILIQADLLEKSANLVEKAEIATNLAKETIMVHSIDAVEKTEEREKLSLLQDQLTVAEQARHAQEQMIKEMTDEIETWREKYEDLVAKHQSGDN